MRVPGVNLSYWTPRQGSERCGPATGWRCRMLRTSVPIVQEVRFANKSSTGYEEKNPMRIIRVVNGASLIAATSPVTISCGSHREGNVEDTWSTTDTQVTIDGTPCEDSRPDYGTDEFEIGEDIVDNDLTYADSAPDGGTAGNCVQKASLPPELGILDDDAEWLCGNLPQSPLTADSSWVRAAKPPLP